MKSGLITPSLVLTFLSVSPLAAIAQSQSEIITIQDDATEQPYLLSNVSAIETAPSVLNSTDQQLVSTASNGSQVQAVDLNDYLEEDPTHYDAVALSDGSSRLQSAGFDDDQINLATFDLHQSLDSGLPGDRSLITFSAMPIDHTAATPTVVVPSISTGVKSLDELDAITNTPQHIAQAQFVAQDISPEEEAELAALEALSQVLYGFNHSPYVFGSLTTVVEDLGSNTQLTGDWGGFRQTLARNGIFFDAYFTTVPQGVVSGGNGGGTAVTQNLDVLLNFSTDLLDWWSGGIFHVGFESKIGSALDEAGALSPVNFGSTSPVADPGNFGLFTEYFWFQALAPNVQMTIGKVNATHLADTNVFANNYRYQFQNASLNNNLMLGVYVPPSTWVAGLVWQPTDWSSILTVVADPNGSAENFADNFFDDVVVGQEFDFSYHIDQRPGNFRIAWMYSSVDSVDFSDPLDITRDGVLDFRDPINTKSGAFMALLNFDQYLYLVGENEENEDDGSGSADYPPQNQFATPRGFGIFGRLGFGPESENFINLFLSLGLGGKGLLGRDYDEFGLGFYHLNFTDETTDLLREIELIVGGEADFGSESGIEAYYNFAVTPAFQLALNAQYIFDPFFSEADHAFILGGRVQINF